MRGYDPSINQDDLDADDALAGVGTGAADLLTQSRYNLVLGRIRDRWAWRGHAASSRSAARTRRFRAVAYAIFRRRKAASVL